MKAQTQAPEDENRPERSFPVQVFPRVLLRGRALSPTRARILVALTLAPDGLAPDHLVEAIWKDNIPASAQSALRNSIGIMRKLLSPVASIVHVEGRYLLDATADSVDLWCLERLAGSSPPASDSLTDSQLAHLFDDSSMDGYQPIESREEVETRVRRAQELLTAKLGAAVQHPKQLSPGVSLPASKPIATPASVGLAVKEHRLWLGVTQEQFARELGMSTASIKKIEAGHGPRSRGASSYEILSRFTSSSVADEISRLPISGDAPPIAPASDIFAAIPRSIADFFAAPNLTCAIAPLGEPWIVSSGIFQLIANGPKLLQFELVNGADGRLTIELQFSGSWLVGTVADLWGMKRGTAMFAISPNATSIAGLVNFFSVGNSLTVTSQLVGFALDEGEARAALDRAIAMTMPA